MYLLFNISFLPITSIWMQVHRKGFSDGGGASHPLVLPIYLNPITYGGRGGPAVFAIWIAKKLAVGI